MFSKTKRELKNVMAQISLISKVGTSN